MIKTFRLRKKLGNNKNEKGIILILTDDIDIRNTFKLLFKDSGYKLMFESKGIKMLEKLHKYKNKRIKLLILAIELPDMSGLDMIHKLKYINDSVKTLLIDNFGVSEIMQQTLNFGADYMIRRPFIPEHILKSINKILN